MHEEHGSGARALFLDLDGTVRETKTGRVHPIEPWDQTIRHGVLQRLRQFRDAGYVLVAVTNQGGVAYGIFTEEDVQAINRRLVEKLAPGLFDLVLYCPHHPRGRLSAYRNDAECRKPRPGMAFEARDRLGLDLARSLMVGDMETDREFAENAGIRTYYWADEFFDDEFDPSPHLELDGAGAATRTASKAPAR